MKKHDAILIEWKKIKDANIFPSFEDFEKLFDSKPNGRCFRKYTSYPWSQENFFFGTYQEFADFQRTTTEIPFYLANKVGTRVYSLTILSFFRNANNKICAKCRCDCGKEVIKTYAAISRGNAHSCGCHFGKGKITQKDTLYAMFQEIVDAYWDFEKNDISPENVSLDSKEDYWWKGYNESFKMPISYIIRTDSGTSFPEQAISYFLKQNNIEVINRYHMILEGKTYELDIFLPQFNVGIEYDGSFWHINKKAKEIQKNNAMEKANITFVRIREFGLLRTGIKNGAEIMMSKPTSRTSLVDCVNKLLTYLETVSTLTFKKVTLQDFDKSKDLIRKQYIGYNDDNLANSPLLRYWSKENSIEPYFVSTKATSRYIFECEDGAKFYASPYALIEKLKDNVASNSTACIFNTRCGRTDKVLKNIQVSLVDFNFVTENICETKLIIENNSHIYFQAIEVSDYYVKTARNFSSYDKRKNAIISLDTQKISEKSIKCFPDNDRCCGNNAVLEILPNTKSIYTIRFELKNQYVVQEKWDLVVAYQLLDQMNWVYKICINIEKVFNDIKLFCQIYSWERFLTILQNNKKRFSDKLNKSETQLLLYELQKYKD